MVSAPPPCEMGGPGLMLNQQQQQEQQQQQQQQQQQHQQQQIIELSLIRKEDQPRVVWV